MDIVEKIASQIGVQIAQVQRSIALLDEGATVPFIARYRKEVTGGLTDTHLRDLERLLSTLRELEDRRKTVLDSIEKQGKLTDELKSSILNAETKAAIEDLYLPYKPKRRTKAQIAREAGLQPLADTLLKDPAQNPQTIAAEYLNTEAAINTVEDALEGAKQILMEEFAENAELLGSLREFVWTHAMLASEVVPGKEEAGVKFSDYFNHSERLKATPSHRALALFRGRNEGFLRVQITLTDEEHLYAREKIAECFKVVDLQRPADQWLLDVVRWTWKVKLLTKLELDLLGDLREHAEDGAFSVFAENLKHLLMAAPAGSKVTMGLDPGLRTGVKVVVIDKTGKLLTHTTIFPHAPREQWKESLQILGALCQKLNVELIAIGNGTASRETDKLAADLLKLMPDQKMTKIMVSEAGASVYSASELAAAEFPELDVSFRGAVSIARRLQDPLAELVKIDPKSIGVGQYQHDVNQAKLSQSLENVVVDCVNAVGVDVNTASAPLLSSVAGLNQTLAKNIVEYRNTNGAFKNRADLHKVPRMGEKTFEQAAGFLRIMNGENPLDASGVHPEAYPVVEKILVNINKDLQALMGKSEEIRKIRAVEYVNERFGLPTIQDILVELEKPGRDPRPEFKTAEFKDGVEEISDLKAGMILEGVVTNVAQFGAFVDIGVHQDGLVHKSAMAARFVQDPKDVVKVGDIVKVRVVDVDIKRKRIGLTMILDDNKKQSKPEVRNHSQQSKAAVIPQGNLAMADALKAAMTKKDRV
jgi:uncharacterized protein